MTQHYPPEFKGDVVALARRGEIRTRRSQPTWGSETTLYRWIRQADVERGTT